MEQEDIKFVVDIETTGLDFRREKIIEIAAVKLVNNNITDTFDSLVNPMQHIRFSSINIHGINEEMILEAPTIEEVLPQVLDFIQDKPIIGHNVIFDYSFLNHAALTLYGKELTNRRIDTLQMYKAVFADERSHGLTSLLGRFNVEIETKHRALADSYGLASVYGKLKAVYDERFRWEITQTKNIHYLFERYLRLQSLIQSLQNEMGDLKTIFKVYFEGGGESIKASTGEILTMSTRQSYQYDFDSVKEILVENDMLDRVVKLDTGLLDKMINGISLDDEIKEKLSQTRMNLSEHPSVTIQKPDKITELNK